MQVYLELIQLVTVSEIPYVHILMHKQDETCLFTFTLYTVFG